MDSLLSLPILDSKSDFDISENFKIVNLCERNVWFNQKNTPVIGRFIVDNMTAGKPHLISRKVYGSENYSDIILSFNGISNPLSVEYGITLYIPDLQFCLNNINSNKLKNKKQNESKKLFQKRLSDNQLKEINAIIEVGEPRLPNMVAEGAEQITFVDGDTMILGTDIVDTKRCGKNLSENQILSERIKEAVRIKINETLGY